MHSQVDESLRRWIRELPPSRMVPPASLINRLKYVFWKHYTPYHSFVRDTLLWARVIRHRGRQDFVLGTIAPEESLRGLISHLVDRGYGNHFVAWKDEGELVSLRYVEDFKYQYHLRVFENGEVRGHYEYTPECHPILHLKDVGLEDRRSVFLEVLGSKIIPASPQE